MNIHNVCGEKYSIYIERNFHEKLITYKTNKKLADVMQIRERKTNRYIPKKNRQYK